MGRKKMRRNIIRFVSLIIAIMLMCAFSLPAFASNGRSSGQQRSFKDVPKGYWAYDEIMWMLERKIVEGIGENLFNPNSEVKRAEFAKMMVSTLDLKIYSPETPSFQDVKKNSWEYRFVESAKPYLTGFRISGADYFKPSLPAVREDMAVALVKALGYHNEPADESILSMFADAGQISPKLKKYVALAVKHGLMNGLRQNGQLVFDPQGNLTRAEASKLLYRAFKSYEEKVTYDEEKVTYDDELYIEPSVSVSYENGKTVVRWEKIDSPRLLGYAVVISANDSSPEYPDNGFLYYITDKNRTYAVVDNSTQYNGTSDFGKYLSIDREYYFSVTAVYTDKTVAGNAVRKTYYGSGNDASYAAPTVYTTVENGVTVARWNKIDSGRLKGYAVVISKNDTTPKYPDNGYLYYITDKNTTYAVINNKDKYNGGDFGNYLTKGGKYYISITAVYDDRFVAGNTVQFEYSGAENPEAYVAPVVSSSIENGRLVLRWNKIDSANLLGYRVVASRNDSSPSYPENGYLYWITDRNKNYAVVDNSTAYTDGDFGGYFVNGENYYFSVTAVYKDKNVPGNAIKRKYEGQDNTDLFPAPVISAEYENGQLVIKWNKIESPHLVEYRVVISRNDQTPSYPDNGFYGAYDKNTTSAALSVNVNYTNGDFEKLEDGTEYYLSVTAVYGGNKYVTGNTVKKLFLLPPD